MIRRLLLVVLALAPVAVGGFALFGGDALQRALKTQEAALRDAGVRFDGVYQSPPHIFSRGQYWDYLRFYPNGDVISIGSTDTPQELAQWFARGAQTVRHGQVKVNGRQLSFNLDAGDDDRMAYAGEVSGDRLRFSIVDDGEAAGAKMVFRLVRLKLPQDTKDTRNPPQKN